MANRLVPGTSMVMAFRLNGSTSFTTNGISHIFSSPVISGLRKTPRQAMYTPGSSTLLVEFKEMGAAAFFKLPLHELFEQSIALPGLVHRQLLSDTEEQLHEAVTDKRKIGIIEKFLAAQLQTREADLLVSSAVQIIKKTNGATKIKDLAATLYISHDAFEKRFRKTTGATPKQFASIVRLRHLIGSYTQNQSLTDIAHEAGYYDQAHFIKDFRSFTGQSPNDFFASGAWW